MSEGGLTSVWEGRTPPPPPPPASCLGDTEWGKEGPQRVMGDRMGVGLGQTSISAPGIMLCSPLWDDDEDQGVAETSEEVPTWGA